MGIQIVFVNFLILKTSKTITEIYTKIYGSVTYS